MKVRLILKQSCFMPRREANCRAKFCSRAADGVRFWREGNLGLRALAVGVSFCVCFMLPLWRVEAEAVGGGAVALVNSASAKYSDFQHFIQPYLDHFGVPYSVVDIRTNAAVINFYHDAVIIVGHGQIGMNHVLLSSC